MRKRFVGERVTQCPFAPQPGARIHYRDSASLRGAGSGRSGTPRDPLRNDRSVCAADAQGRHACGLEDAVLSERAADTDNIFELHQAREFSASGWTASVRPKAPVARGTEVPPALPFALLRVGVGMTTV